MIDKQTILANLEQGGIPVLGTVIRDSVGNDHAFIYIQVQHNADGHQVPSNRSLHRARERLGELGVVVEFILTDALTQDMEAGVRATLLHAFGDEIRNAFLSVEKGKATVWIEQKKTFDEAMKAAVRKKASVFLKEVGLELGALLVTNEENIPGKLAFLKAIRQVSPAEPNVIRAELVNRGFSVPSDDWLRRKLDTLRKNDAIVRLASGHYVLPSKTFDVLGTVRAGRSPDVTRLLALAWKSR
jgi:hypothetical protein